LLIINSLHSESRIILNYVNKRIYDEGIDYQGWRLQQRETIE